MAIQDPLRTPATNSVCHEQRVRTGRIRGLLIFPLLAMLPVAIGLLAQEEYLYVFCQQDDFDNQTVFYSGVFINAVGTTTGYENDFYDYLVGRGWNPSRGSSYCSLRSTRRETLKELRESIEKLPDRVRVMRTNWVPDSSKAAGTDRESFSAQPLQDFHISVPRSPYDLRVCVRDHECEDGDKVRVSINGSPLISTEIVNEWSCQDVALWEGRHEIGLYALNGTGYKGDCSYADANTGEIRVTGENSQTQSWKHRGGKGSTAKIVVTVR